MLQSYGVYVAALREQFGWSKTLFSAAFSMSRVESGLLGPLHGVLVDRFGPRILAHVGLGMVAAGLVWFSQVNSPVTFFLAFFTISVGASLGGFPTVMVAVVNWFDRRRSLAIGLTSTGFAIGGLSVTLVVVAIDAFGWRATAFTSGLIMLVAGQLLASVLRHRPEDMGLQVDGAPERVMAGVGAPGRVRRPDFTTRQALRTHSFWFISLGHGSALLVVSAVMVHLVVHLDEALGYSTVVIAAVLAVMTGSQIVGQLAGGVLGDLINKRLICVVCMAGHVAALLLLGFASAYWMVFTFAVVHGTAWGARGPLMQAIRADYFGRTSYGTINGFSSLIVMLGMTTGPLVAGILADRTGNYETGFAVLSGMAAVGTVFFVLATPPRAPGRHGGEPAAPARVPARAEG
jgi:sugar phosphate permease